MKVQSNASIVIGGLLKNLQSIEANPGTRLAATVSLGILDMRIWSNSGAKNSKGNRLKPNYSKGYMYTRKKYNRGKSRVVILSLTGDMQNQFNVVALGGEQYGIGWSGIGAYDRGGVANIAKRNWLEKLYKGKIWWMSDKEIKEVSVEVADHVNKILG